MNEVKNFKEMVCGNLAAIAETFLNEYKDAHMLDTETLADEVYLRVPNDKQSIRIMHEASGCTLLMIGYTMKENEGFSFSSELPVYEDKSKRALSYPKTLDHFMTIRSGYSVNIF